jgi:hypothetical protein
MRYGLLFLSTAIGLAGCYKSTVSQEQCKNDPTAELLSPDGQWKSVSFLRECGAAPLEAHVSVLPVTSALGNEPGNAFREEASRAAAHYSFRIQQVWKGPRELWVGHAPDIKVAYSASQVGDVTIVHKAGEVLEP